MSSSSSSSSVSGSSNGVPNAPFPQTQNTFPGAGYGYNYGNVYPQYPFFNPFGANQVQAGPSLNNRNSFEDDVPNFAHNTLNPQLYAPNTLIAPLDYGQYFQQQQNAYV